MVWLSLGNISLVVTHNEKRLSKLNVMHEANQLILAIPEGAPEVDDAEDTEAKFEKEGEDGHLHQVLADLDVVGLNIFQLLGELRLLLHVSSLLLATSITHLLPNIIHMILVHWIVMFEKTHSLLPCITFISVIT